MALRIRTSKFRHVYGTQCRREQTFENVRITRNTHDSNFCSVNPRSLAVVTESSGGGSFAILDVNRPGRVDVNCPRVCGHEGAVLDIKWNPFDDCIIASGSDDATVKIWTLPESGLLGTLTDWSADLHGHSRRVGYIEWHTTAANILMSVGFDFKIMIWNVEQAEPITSLDCHQDTIFSVSWGNDGSLIASTSKDKQIRIMDPRTAKIAMKTDGHQSAKASKIAFVTEHEVFTTGFSRISDRQYALWDIRKAGTPLVIEDLDSSSGILLPYYDPDTKVIYLAGKGDGNIRYFEVESGSVQFLNTYQSSLPQRGLGMMPKRGVDPYKNEVARFYKLHASKNLVEPVSMIVPRKAEGFQPDVFPPTASRIPSLTADEWTSGINRGPILVDLQTGAIMDKPRSSVSPAVLSQISALSKPPQITTCKAINRAPPTSFNASPTSFSPAPFVKQTSPSSLRASPEGHAQVLVGSPSQIPQTISNQMFGSVNGRERPQQEPASIRNIKCLSMTREDMSDSDSCQSVGQPCPPASAVSSVLGRTLKSPGSPLTYGPSPAASPSLSHHFNGFNLHSSADEHFRHDDIGTNMAATSNLSATPSLLARTTSYTHVGHDTQLQQQFNTTGGSTRPDSQLQPQFNTTGGSTRPDSQLQQQFSTTGGSTRSYSQLQPQFNTTGGSTRPDTQLQQQFNTTGGSTRPDSQLQPQFNTTGGSTRSDTQLQPQFNTTGGSTRPDSQLQPQFNTTGGSTRPDSQLQQQLNTTGGSTRPDSQLQPQFNTTGGSTRPDSQLQPQFNTTGGSTRPDSQLQPQFNTTDGSTRPDTQLQQQFSTTGSSTRPDSQLQQQFNTTGGSTNPEHGASKMSAAATTSQLNAIHVRKVWTPPAESTTASMSHVTSNFQPGVPTPGTDMELKKAYFRQLEEIRSLQEQLLLKDRRIKQLELELSHFQDKDADMKSGESKC